MVERLDINDARMCFELTESQVEEMSKRQHEILDPKELKEKIKKAEPADRPSSFEKKKENLGFA